jgi:hypothetical protein
MLIIKKSTRLNILYGCFAASLLFFAGVSSASADAVDDLVTASDKIDGVYEGLVPPAVGSTAFLIAAKILKRVALA